MRIRVFRLILIVSCLVQLSAQQTQFFKTYSMGLYDIAEEVLVIQDTSYIVAGTTQTGGMNGSDLLLFKTNSTGQLTWWKNIGGTGIENGKALVPAKDSSGYLIAGLQNNLDSVGYEVLLTKTDFNGNLIWSKTYGGNNWELCNAMGSLSDTTYILVGETFSYGAGQKDVYVIKVDSDGDTLWTKTFGGTNHDYAKNILVDRHDNALIIGSTESYGAGNYDAWLIYINSDGDTLWTKTIGTAEDDFGYSADMNIGVTNTLGFIVGYTSYYAPDLAQNSYLLKIDSLGNSLATYPQMEATAEILDHIQVQSVGADKAAFVADIKYAYNEVGIIYMLRMSDGFTPWVQNTYGSGGNEGSYPSTILQTLDKGFIIAGYCENWGPGPTSAFLLKTDSMTVGPNTPVVSVEQTEEAEPTIFPNPVEGNYFYINTSSELKSVSLFTLTGQLIKKYDVTPNQLSVMIEKPFISSGIYLLEVNTLKGNFRSKIKF